MTAANVQRSQASHYYWPNGEPCFEIAKKSGNGMKKTTIREARELGLLPSTTTILKCLDRPALTSWLIEQSVLAVVTTPRKEGEKDDAFIQRVLHEEKVQDQEAATAAERGSAVHDAIASAIKGEPFDPQWRPYVQAALSCLETLGKVVWIEKVVVGDGYAGRADICLENDRNLIILDWKSCKTLPKTDSWDEHKLQTASYSATLGTTGDKRILTANLYLSTTVPGQTAFFLQEDWKDTYENGFVPLLKVWRWLNSYPKGGQP